MSQQVASMLFLKMVDLKYNITGRSQRQVQFFSVTGHRNCQDVA